MTTCSRSQQCSILFCDEMCSVVPHLNVSILEHLCEQVTSTFQDTFLVEAANGVPQEVGLPMGFCYGLDEDVSDDGSIALNLLPMVLASKSSPEGGAANGDGLIGMAARFHLLRTCEQQLNGNLEGIDALLGKQELVLGTWE